MLKNIKRKKLKKQIKLIFLLLALCGVIFLIILLLPKNKYDTNEEKTSTKRTTSKIKDELRSANLTVVGDLLFEQPYYDAISSGEDKNQYFSQVKNYFEEDDLSIGNMEVVIGNDDLKPSGEGYNFCAPKYIGDIVKALDFEVLSTANNHSYDRGLKGILSTLDYFENNTDIMTVGTYKSVEDKNKLYIKEINNIKFGFLSYTLGTNIKPNENDASLISYYRDQVSKTVTTKYKEMIKSDVTKLKENADVVIVIMHWGKEFTFTPNEEQKSMASYLNSLGVDIIVGSHSHSIQPIEMIGDKHKTLVYYSLGNFVSADDDIARTPKGEETFDNAYQFGLLSTLNVTLDNDNNVIISNIKAEPIINYFNKNMKDFILIPYSKYSETYENTHFRYNLGFDKNFIEKTFNDVIDKKYHFKSN